MFDMLVLRFFLIGTLSVIVTSLPQEETPDASELDPIFYDADSDLSTESFTANVPDNVDLGSKSMIPNIGQKKKEKNSCRRHNLLFERNL